MGGIRNVVGKYEERRIPGRSKWRWDNKVTHNEGISVRSSFIWYRMGINFGYS
jgi:hypothetical protein